MILFFVEWPEQVDRALNKIEGQKDILFVAFTTLVAYELEKRKVNYIYPDKYFLLKENKKVFSEHYEQLEKLCRWADLEIGVALPYLKNNNIFPFMFNYFFIKNLWDSLANRIFQIISLINNVDVSKIYYFYHDKFEPVGQPDTCQIIKVISNAINKFEELHFDYRMVKSHLFKNDNQSIKLLTKKNRFYMRISSFLEKSWRLLCFSRNNKFLVFHNVDCAFLKTIFKESFSYINGKKIDSYLMEINPSKDVYKEIKKILSNCIIREHFFFHNIDFSILFMEKIEKIVTGSIPSEIQIRNVKKIIDGKKIKNVILKTLVNPRHKIIATISKNIGSKVSVFQHGAMGIHNEKIIYYCDLLFATDFYVYGEGVKKYFEKNVMPHDCRIHLFDSRKILLNNQCISRKSLCKGVNLDLNKIIFVFQISGIGYNQFYYSFNTPGDYEEYKNHRKIIEYFKENQELQLIVKLHPSCYNIESPLFEYLEILSKSKNIRFLRDIPMNMLLNSCDKFITDRPSTGMFQAMLYKKECFSYNEVIDFWGDDGSIVDSVNYFKNPEDLIVDISMSNQKTKRQETEKYIEKFVCSHLYHFPKKDQKI